MTKKDFIGIAKILNRYDVPVNLVRELSDYFEKENPSFNAGKFINTCLIKIPKQEDIQYFEGRMEREFSAMQNGCAE